MQVIFKKHSLYQYSDKTASSQSFIQGDFCYKKLIYIWYDFSRICAYIFERKQKN